jgi:ubiquinone/menaquinone biosynthesis C-methylase UbiE
VKPAEVTQNARVATAYDAWHRSQGSHEEEISAPWHFLARDHLPANLQNTSVLEAGCGRGAFARYLAERGARVTAVDISPAAAEMTRAALAPFSDCTASAASIEALPFSDGTFDLVVSLDTLEHVFQPKRAVAELVRVLRPGGTVIVTTSNYLSLVGAWRLAMWLVGRTYTEAGQPVNQPLIAFPRQKYLHALGCRVTAVDGCGHYIRMPKTAYGYVRLRLFDRGRPVTKWFGTHRLVAAERIASSNT